MINHPALSWARIAFAKSAIILLALYILGGWSMNARAADRVPSAAWTNCTSVDKWHGFQRYHFTVAGCHAWVVEPVTVAGGNPWTWSLAFPDAYTERCATLQLLTNGYYAAFIDVGNTFGCPNAIKQFNAFYQMLTRQGLNSKPVLIGISRGGLYAYRWAAENPGKVGAIYGDAPVCDFKSWPGGKGHGQGSPKDWQPQRLAVPAGGLRVQR